MAVVMIMSMSEGKIAFQVEEVNRLEGEVQVEIEELSHKHEVALEVELDVKEEMEVVEEVKFFKIFPIKKI